MSDFQAMLGGILDRARAAAPPTVVEPVEAVEAEVVEPEAEVVEVEAVQPEVADEYDPGEYSVAEVVAYVQANPDARAAVRALEESGKARSTLLATLAD